MNLQEFKELIETRLDIPETLTIEDHRIIPKGNKLTRNYIRDHHLDDLFSFHEGVVYFTNRFMTFVGEITDRQVLTSHYFMILRDA